MYSAKDAREKITKEQERAKIAEAAILKRSEEELRLLKEKCKENAYMYILPIEQAIKTAVDSNAIAITYKVGSNTADYYTSLELVKTLEDHGYKVEIVRDDIIRGGDNGDDYDSQSYHQIISTTYSLKISW